MTKFPLFTICNFSESREKEIKNGDTSNIKLESNEEKPAHFELESLKRLTWAQWMTFCSDVPAGVWATYTGIRLCKYEHAFVEISTIKHTHTVNLKISMQKIFLLRPQKFFDNENFQIYGTSSIQKQTLWYILSERHTPIYIQCNFNYPRFDYLNTSITWTVRLRP